MEKALYACDQCYRCKTRCAKELPRCQRCQKQKNVCTYSVTGSEIFTLAGEITTDQTDAAHTSRHTNSVRFSICRRDKPWTNATQGHRALMSKANQSSQIAVTWSRKAPEGELKPALSPNHSISSHSDVYHNLLQTARAETPQDLCDCIRRNLEFTRDIYLGSIRWDTTHNMTVLNQGILSCEPCLSCSATRCRMAAISSLLFLQRALMCMTQASFPLVAAFGDGGLALLCQSILSHLQANFSLGVVDGPESLYSVSQLYESIQKGFTGLLAGPWLST